MELFGPPGEGTYDAIMSRTAQDYMSQPSPYAGMSEFLLNRPVFDRGPSPERQPMAAPTPTFSYGNQAGASGLTALSAQQPMLQEQYDQFAQQIQSAQEAAQQQAQQQTDLAASERQALMDRITALEGQEGPDLDAFGAQIRQDILGQIPEQIDVDALRREITGEVLAVAQQDFPDVNQIRDEVMRLLPEQEQVDVENLRRQIQESIDAGAPPEQIEALRQELQNRIRPVEEQLATIQDERPDIARQIGELRGEIGALPDIDVEELRAQIINQLPEQERLDIEDLQRRIQESIDAGAPEQEIQSLRTELNTRLQPVEDRVGQIRESIGQLRAQVDLGPQIDVEDIRRQVQERLEDRFQSPDFNPNAQRQIDELRRQFEEGRGRVDPDVLERLRSVEQREAPDLSGIREQIGRLRGRLDERPTVDPDAIARRVRESIDIPQVDLSDIQTQIAALEDRGLPPQVLERLRAVEQREGPDEAAIAERIRSGLDPRIEDLQQRFSEVDTSSQAMAERIARLRGRLDERPTIDSDAIARQVRESIDIPQVDLSGLQTQIAALENRGLPPEVLERLRAVEQREGPDLGSIREQIGALRGRLDERPVLDESAITRRIKESIKPQRIDVDALRRQIQEGIQVPRVDLGDIRQQLGALQGRLDQRPQVTTEDVQRLIKQGLANRTTAGVKPTPRVRGRI
jgi:ABC-type phosphate transport system auxiliary subunit